MAFGPGACPRRRGASRPRSILRILEAPRLVWSLPETRRIRLQNLHDWGRLQGTGGNSRGLDRRGEAAWNQGLTTEVVRHQPVSHERVIGVDSRRLHQHKLLIIHDLMRDAGACPASLQQPWAL